MTEITITLNTDSLVDFLGTENQTIRKISSCFPESKIISRGNEVKIIGTKTEVSHIEEIFKTLLNRLNHKGAIETSDIELLVNKFSNGNNNDEIVENNDSFENDIIIYGPRGNIIRAKTFNQKKLVKSIIEHDIVFAVGAAGGGKTYTAVAIALKALKNKEVKRIIITRPAVEAGENLGFLPGDLMEKIDPYLRPVYDALNDMLEPEKLKTYLENRIIEIAPLAYMRGRTLSNAFIILDEAQNATELQIKMFLTRIGLNSKVIVTGDMTQVDLPPNQKSGLIQSIELLNSIRGISVIIFTIEDVMRHRLVKEIVKAYEKIK